MKKTHFIGLGQSFVVLSIAILGGCGDGGTATSTDTSASTGTGGTTTSTGTGGTTTSTGTGATGSGGGSQGGPDEAFLPAATGPCPEFVEGKITVTPDGKPRDVQIWISEAAQSLDGPLIFYWHGTGSSPVVEPPYGIDPANIAAIKDQGGIIAAPFHDPAAGQFPWFLTTGTGPEDDIRVADEILACAIEKVGVDKRRIHSMGMSAGGLQTAQMSYRRSGYLASVVTYSGGKLGVPPDQDPSNKLAAMIFHGGATDMVVIGFQAISEAYRDDLRSKGHFAFICDHGMGHSIPTDARNSVHQFLQDHPFGTDPSPYVSGLPSGFPSYCSL
jgi:predicted esterase